MNLDLLCSHLNQDVGRVSQEIVVPIGIGWCTTFGGNYEEFVTIFNISIGIDMRLITFCSKCVRK